MKFSLTCALLAAALFGASTPLAKLLGGEIPPVLLAGLLYLGSGVGLAIIRILRDGGWISAGLSAPEWRWLIGAIAFGGIAGPIAPAHGGSGGGMVRDWRGVHRFALLR